MKYLIPIAIFTMFTTGCVVKKDSAASAAVSAEIATQLAKGFSDPTGASGSMSGTSAAITATCTAITNGFRCSSGGFEMERLIVGSTLSGYQKMTGVAVTVGGKVYTVNGRIDMTGSTTTSGSGYNATTGQFNTSTNYNQVFNGTLKITGPDNFDVEYKAYSVNVSMSLSGTIATLSYTFSFTCGGKLVVDTVDFPVKSDCSI
jgi:hypothetical protein